MRRRAPGGPTLPQQPPAHYDRYLDGLFTYCLSVLCDHDAATAALGDALALAERHQARLRNLELRRPWLYALARYACRGRHAGAAEAGGRALPGS
ncbi:sigma-70 family RNA polymerase sigma factor, partial [Streptomyces sp. NPDC059506]